MGKLAHKKSNSFAVVAVPSLTTFLFSLKGISWSHVTEVAVFETSNNQTEIAHKSQWLLSARDLGNPLQRFGIGDLVSNGLKDNVEAGNIN